jgi:type IV pilus assembly protein PilV
MNAIKPTSRKPLRRAARQRGSFLLEALISVLIVAFGVLGLIGLQARAIQNVDDAQYRGEAAYLANALIGQMWASDPATLGANFDNTSGGPAYTEFKAMVDQRLPGATALDPVVTVAAGPTATSSSVLIQVFWKPPGELAAAPMHRYEVGAIVGAN